MLDENDLIKQLEQFAVPGNCPVIVHSSMKSIGYIDGGAKTLLNALRKHFIAVYKLARIGFAIRTKMRSSHRRVLTAKSG